MGEFLLLFLTLLVLFAALLAIGFGQRIRSVSSFGIALANLFSYVVTGDGDGFDMELVKTPGLSLSWIEWLLGTLVYLALPFFIIFTVMSFFLAFIEEVFGEEK